MATSRLECSVSTPAFRLILSAKANVHPAVFPCSAVSQTVPILVTYRRASVPASSSIRRFGLFHPTSPPWILLRFFSLAFIARQQPTSLFRGNSPRGQRQGTIVIVHARASHICTPIEIEIDKRMSEILRI